MGGTGFKSGRRGKRWERAIQGVKGSGQIDWANLDKKEPKETHDSVAAKAVVTPIKAAVAPTATMPPVQVAAQPQLVPILEKEEPQRAKVLGRIDLSTRQPANNTKQPTLAVIDPIDAVMKEAPWVKPSVDILRNTGYFISDIEVDESPISHKPQTIISFTEKHGGEPTPRQQVVLDIAGDLNCFNFSRSWTDDKAQGARDALEAYAKKLSDITALCESVYGDREKAEMLYNKPHVGYLIDSVQRSGRKLCADFRLVRLFEDPTDSGSNIVVGFNSESTDSDFSQGSPQNVFYQVTMFPSGLLIPTTSFSSRIGKQLRQIDGFSGPFRRISHTLRHCSQMIRTANHVCRGQDNAAEIQRGIFKKPWLLPHCVFIAQHGATIRNLWFRSACVCSDITELRIRDETQQSTCEVSFYGKHHVSFASVSSQLEGLTSSIHQECRRQETKMQERRTHSRKAACGD